MYSLHKWTLFHSRQPIVSTILCEIRIGMFSIVHLFMGAKVCLNCYIASLLQLGNGCAIETGEDKGGSSSILLVSLPSFFMNTSNISVLHFLQRSGILRSGLPPTVDQRSGNSPIWVFLLFKLLIYCISSFIFFPYVSIFISVFPCNQPYPFGLLQVPIFWVSLPHLVPGVIGA